MKSIAGALATVPLIIAAIAAMAALSPLRHAQAEDRLIDSEQCVSLRGIDRTRIVDEQNIIFYMKNGDIYRNQLPRRCPGLNQRNSFMYRTSLNQLCNVDIITVLQNIGFGFSPGISCGLGMFVPIDEITVQELMRSE